MSLGVSKSGYPEVCALASKLIKDKGVLIVAAAGNDPKVIMCPAAAQDVISVGATGMIPPMEPTIFASGTITFKPSATSAAQEITCDAGVWRTAYLDQFANGKFQNIKDSVRKCPETARSVASQLFDDSGSAYRRNDCDATLEFAAASFQIAVERDDAEQKGVALNEVGVAYACRGDLSKAFLMYSRAAELHKIAGDLIGEEVTLNNLGELEQSTGDFAGSMTTLNSALELARKPEVHDREGETAILGNLCIADYSIGKLTDAQVNCNLALTQARSEGNDFLVGRNLLNLGSIYAKEKNFTNAREYFGNAHTCCISSGDVACARTAEQELSEMKGQ
jgi:tetratricopeptide (TPR) repeat protein